MARKDCYIDHTLCSGAKYSFCDDCKKAQKQENYNERITKATTPAEVSLAHIPSPSKETCREVNECPLGGDSTNDCEGCAYSGDYHCVNGDCVERPAEVNLADMQRRFFDDIYQKEYEEKETHVKRT